jgi:predicted nucleic acid-binding protein
VLQKYFAAATRKLGVETDTAKRKTRLFSRLHTVQITPADILAAIEVHQLHAVSFWDALIVHAARQAGCSVLLSEDMSHNQTIEGVRIHNPFLQTGAV